MKNLIIFTALALGLCFMTEAAVAKKVKCTMVETKKEAPKSVSVTVGQDNDEYASSKNLKLGKYAFNLVLQYNDDSLYVTIQENNSVQDEVGSLGCEVKTMAYFV